MRIALFTDGIYPYVIGGMQKHSFYLTKYLAGEKVFVDLYHTNNSSYDIDQLECFSPEEKKYILSVVIPFPKIARLPGHYIRASFSYSERIFEVFKERNNVDFIYAKGFTAWKLLKEKQKGYVCSPVGVNFHGYEMFQKAPDFKTWLQHVFLLREPVRYNAKHADGLFSYGGSITQIIKKNIPGYPRVMEIPAGIEAEWLNSSPGLSGTPLKFIFIGRYERRKGIEELNRAIQSVTGNFTFTFLGPIPSGKQLKQENISYAGSVSDANEIRNQLKRHDILVCPSHSEGMPNVILEAMACGLAIIASDVGAVSKMVSEQNGILILPGIEKEIKKAMETFISMDTQTLFKMKENSLNLVKHKFLWKDIVVKTVEEISIIL